MKSLSTLSKSLLHVVYTEISKKYEKRKYLVRGANLMVWCMEN